MVVEGLRNSLGTASRALPLILCAFMVIGMLELLVSREQIKNLLGKYPGLRGLLLTAAAGGLVPGGPYVFYPLVSSSVADQGIHPSFLFAFVAGKHAWDAPRLPMEISLVGVELTLWRNILTLPYPLVGAMVISALSRRDPGGTIAEVVEEGQ